MPWKNSTQVEPASPMPNAIGTPMSIVAKKMPPMTSSIMPGLLSTCDESQTKE